MKKNDDLSFNHLILIKQKNYLGHHTQLENQWVCPNRSIDITNGHFTSLKLECSI